MRITSCDGCHYVSMCLDTMAGTFCRHCWGHADYDAVLAQDLPMTDAQRASLIHITDAFTQGDLLHEHYDDMPWYVTDHVVFGHGLFILPSGTTFSIRTGESIRITL